MKPTILIMLIPSFITLASGCSFFFPELKEEKREILVRVEGNVTYNGQSLPDTEVQFIKPSGAGIYVIYKVVDVSKTDAFGRYDLSYQFRDCQTIAGTLDAIKYSDSLIYKDSLMNNENIPYDIKCTEETQIVDIVMALRRY